MIKRLLRILFGGYIDSIDELTDGKPSLNLLFLFVPFIIVLIYWIFFLEIDEGMSFSSRRSAGRVSLLYPLLVLTLMKFAIVPGERRRKNTKRFNILIFILNTVIHSTIGILWLLLIY